MAAACVVMGFAAGAATSAAAPPDPGWARQALSLQNSLGDDLGFANAGWVGTHNSFNSVAEMGITVSDLDSNQRISLVDQLNEGMRSIELDLHQFPSLRGELGLVPLVCHATDPDLGCTVEKPFSQVAPEVAGWLRAHPHEVILLYLEDALRTPEGHAQAAATLTKAFGKMIYKPPSGKCTKLPLAGLTRNDVRAAGAQIVTVASHCGQGAAWPALVYDWTGHKETRPIGFKDYPNCGPDFKRSDYDTNLVRYFEDSTIVNRVESLIGAAEIDDGIGTASAAAMERCGVDLIGFDQLSHNDQRVASTVWSWADGQPSGPWHCAVERVGAATPYGRFFTDRCATKKRPLCRRGASWLIPAKKVNAQVALKTCRKYKARSAVPRTGYETQLVRAKMAARKTGEVWLGYRLSGGGWHPLDKR